MSYLQNCHHHHLSSSRRDGVCTPANVGDGVASSGQPRAAPPSKPIFAPPVFAQNRPLGSPRVCHAPMLATPPHAVAVLSRRAVASLLLKPSSSSPKSIQVSPLPLLAQVPRVELLSSSAQSGNRRRHGRLPSTSPWSPYPGPSSFQTGHPATFPSLPGSSQARARLESTTGALPPPCATTVGRFLPWSRRLRQS